MPTITIVHDTVLKDKLLPSAKLKDSEKQPLKKGTKLDCQVIGAKGGHGIVKLEDTRIRYLFNAHFEGQEEKAGDVANTAVRHCVEPKKLKNALMQLKSPNVPESEVDDVVEAFLNNAAKYTITKRSHAIHFWAQCLHESGCLMYLEELASGNAYTNRDDLGNCCSEARQAAAQAGMAVGPFYKGHSLIQTTGYTNHRDYGKFAGIDAVHHPELLTRYPDALNAAMYFWMTRNPTLSDDVDKGGMNDETCKKITKVVNGGYNGLSHRLELFHKLNKLL